MFRIRNTREPGEIFVLGNSVVMLETHLAEFKFNLVGEMWDGFDANEACCALLERHA